MDDPIREILKRADDTFEATSSPKELAQRVRRRMQSQQRRRVVLAGVGVLLIAVVLLNWPKDRKVEVAKVTPPPPVYAVEQRVDETDAKVSQLVAELLEKHERQVASQRVSQSDDYLWRLSQERYRTGLILVKSGDRIYQEFHDRQAAEANYRQVIHLFPDSPAATLAQQRLQSFDPKKGSES